MAVTYIILVPHDVQECIQGQVVISPTEAGKSTEDAASEEHAMEVLLCVSEELFDLLARVRSCSLLLTHVC